MKSRRMWVLLAIAVLLSLGLMPPAALSSPSRQPASPAAYVQDRPTDRGPFVSEAVEPYVFDGDLRDLPQLSPDPNRPFEEAPRPLPGGKVPPDTLPTWVDPVAQTAQGAGRMPDPLTSFDGLNRRDWGLIPPDTNGDVGPNHYIQTVNVAIGIFDKVTGQRLAAFSYNDFFTGTGTPCDNGNSGDPVVVYDPLADRWLITDFAIAGFPDYECLALSQSGDPVGGGWYFYALVANGSNGSWNDYPKFGVWPDAYYMSANMFNPSSGSKIWALDRAAMLIGDPLTTVSFELFNPPHWSLLPANLRGDPPPVGAPNYFANIEIPGTLNLWEFHVDWAVPGNSTLTGPIPIPVADFGYIEEIPQPPPGELVDSLSGRLMMQLQYRNFGTYESLWVNHTIPSGGVAGVRWYEVRDPGGTPFLYQQGTFQPDDDYRWMGSLAVDQDGNMALGYSVSSETLYPSIRYAGRLYGEVPGLLPQAEVSLIEGSGSQINGSGRWGDYSAMSVDPNDDCTFWYTQEYYTQTGNIWNTRIGSFRFPSCGQPKGWISGTVYDADTLAPLAGVPVVAEGLTVTTTLTVETDANGDYRMILLPDAYTLTAGPFMPGYPNPATVAGVVVTAGATTTQDIALVPMPYLVGDDAWVDDNVAGANGNGFPEPGESGILLWAAISNTGATTATDVSAHLIALTPGVDVTVADAAYPDISAGASMTNVTPFVLSIAPTVPCGAQLDFDNVVTADQGVFTVPLRIYAKITLPREPLFADDMESGPGDWTTGGTNNLWAITEEQSHSPSHAWSDSPGGNYRDNANAWLRSRFFDLGDISGLVLTFWHRYAFEAGWDFGYVEYSLDGGGTWEPFPASYTGQQPSWAQELLDAAVLDGYPNVAFRFLLTSDSNTNEDGWYIDDVELTHEPYYCAYPALGPAVPILLAPPDGTVTTTHAITFTWEPGVGEIVDGYNLEVDGTVYTTTETFSATVLSGGPHTWRVRAYNSAGYSDYTDPWSLTVIDPPEVPIQLAPSDGTITSSHTLTFTWQAGAGGAPDGYNLELDGVVYTTTEALYTATLAAGPHTWRVRAFNAAGISDYSPSWGLTIVDPPGVPVLLAPPDGTVTGTQAITFSWQAGAGGAPDGYNLELDGTVYTTTDPMLAVTLTMGPHSWRVRAYNVVGTSAYSAPWSVTVLYRVYLPLVVRGY